MYRLLRWVYDVTFIVSIYGYMVLNEENKKKPLRKINDPTFTRIGYIMIDESVLGGYSGKYYRIIKISPSH